MLILLQKQVALILKTSFHTYTEIESKVQMTMIQRVSLVSTCNSKIKLKVNMRYFP